MRITELFESVENDITSTLHGLEVAAQKNPDLEDALKDVLLDLLVFARSKAEKKAKPQPTLNQPRTAPTLTSEPTPNNPNKPVAEDVAGSGLATIVSELKSVISELDPETQKIIDTVLDKVVHKIYQQGVLDTEKSTQKYFSDFESALSPLLEKVSSNKRVQKDVRAQLESWFTKLVLRDRKVSKEQVLAFLKEAADGHIIDMVRLVKTDKGNVANYINPKYKSIFELFKDDVFQYKPGGSGANLGPGEVAFTLLGNPAEKADVGDIRVDGVMYEVKGGNNNMGGRMNSKQVKKPTSGWAWISAFFKKYAPEIEPTYKTEKNKQAMKYNWNARGIKRLNTDLLQAIPTKAKRIRILKMFLDGLWKFMIMNHEEIKDMDAQIDDMIDHTTGTIDIQKAIKNIAHLLYEAYRLSDGERVGKKAPQMNILVLNTETLNYQIVRSAKDLNKVDIKSGISWNDSNTSASPQLYIS